MAWSVTGVAVAWAFTAGAGSYIEKYKEYQQNVYNRKLTNDH